MNWCSGPRSGGVPLTLDLPCCGSRNEITIDVPDMVQEKLVMTSDNKFRWGSVTIDREGLRRVLPNGELAPGKGGTGDVKSLRESLPRVNDQDSNVRLVPGARASHGGDRTSLMNRMNSNRKSAEGTTSNRNSRNALEMRRYSLVQAKRMSASPLNALGLSGLNGLLAGLVGPPPEEKGARLMVKLQDLVKIKGVSECLGKGVSGTVWKVVDSTIQEVFALKEMELEEDEKKCKLIVREMQMMLDIDHPNVVACHGVFYEEHRFQIVMEYMDAGSLYDVLRLCSHNGRKHSLPEIVIKVVANQVLAALHYLHTKHRVIHRDLKPGNILLSRSGCAKLADFGVASRARDSRDSRCASWVGTVTYMSPERIMGNDYTFNSDVWALGVIVVECALGHYPYLVEEVTEEGEKKKFEFWDLLHTVTNTESAHTRLPPTVSDGMRSFAEYVLQKTDDTRPSSLEALMFPWVADAPSNGETLVAAVIHESLQDRRGKDAVALASSMQVSTVSTIGEEDRDSSS